MNLVEILSKNGAFTLGGDLDVHALAAGCAARLRAAGVAQGDRVVVAGPKSPEAIALYLGVLRTGAVYVPLNPAYTESERRPFIDDADPRLIVTDPLEWMQRGDPREPPVELPDDAPAAILFTSGTTGRAKGAVLSHGNLASNALALYRAWGWRSDDVLLHALPIFHVHGLFISLHVAMLGGSRVLFLPRFSLDAVLDALPRATVMMGVPTFYSRLLADSRLGRCDAMRLFVSGSAPLSAATFEAFRERTGHAILERYGMTETGILTANPLDGERVAGSVGYPLEGVELRITDQVEVRGPGVFREYWRAPEKSADSFTADGFFRTGDLGRLDPDGRLHLVGRASDLIISGGYNVYPLEIERCLEAIPGIEAAAVIGVPHGDLGEVPLAVLVGEGVDDGVLSATLESSLVRYKRPRRFHWTDTLPRNAMGKIDKKALRRRYG